MGSRTQLVLHSTLLLSTSNMPRITRHNMHRDGLNTVTIGQRSSSGRQIDILCNPKGISANLQQCITTLNLEAIMNPFRNPGLGRHWKRIRLAFKIVDHKE